jgi:hypothetical protein
MKGRIISFPIIAPASNCCDNSHASYYTYGVSRKSEGDMNVNSDALKIVAELGEVIRLQNEALERLRAFRLEMPYILAPNIAKMVEENLKENIHVLYKELNQAHKPPSERRRNACRQCHMVYASPLPGGVCDECRNQTRSQPAAYRSWPVTPESEITTVSAIDDFPRSSPADAPSTTVNSMSDDAVADTMETELDTQLIIPFDSSTPVEDTINDT